MVRGSFDEAFGRPYVTGRIFIPGLGVKGIVSLVFDTGADGSMLMPLDARDLGVDHTALRTPALARGIGGAVTTYTEPAHLAFLDDDYDGGGLCGYDVSLRICHPTESAMRVPSLLGRDVIDRWRVTYDKSRLELVGEVISCDHRWTFPTR